MSTCVTGDTNPDLDLDANCDPSAHPDPFPYDMRRVVG